MKKLLIGFTSVMVAVILFTGGIFASQWISFTGGDSIDQANNDVEEIMEILRDTYEGKISAEQALADLEELNPPGLVKQIKELKEEIEQLKQDNAVLTTDLAQANDYISHLESELTEANNAVESHSNVITEAVEEARTYSEE